MRRALLIAAALVTFVTTACSDSQQSPIEPAFPSLQYLTACPTAPSIRQQITQLYALGNGLIIAQATFEAIVIKMRLGRTSEAQDLARKLIIFTDNQYKAGRLRPSATAAKVAALNSALACFVGITPPLATDVVVGVVDPNQTTPTTLVTPAKQAGIQIDPTDVTQPTVIAVFAVPVAETLLTNLDKYPPNYQFTTSGGEFQQEVLVGLCPYAPPDILPRLRVAHNVPEPIPSTIEILPRVDAGALGLNCPDFVGLRSDSRNLALRGLQHLGRKLGDLLSPAPLSAATLGTSGVGGTTKKLSVFGAVDPQVVKFGATGYHALFEPGAEVDTTNWSSPGYTHESAWGAPVQAAFGYQSYCELPVHTTWLGADRGVSDILLRKHFTAPVGTVSVSIQLAIDNDAKVFVNGYDITGTSSAPKDEDGFANHEGCPSVTIPDAAFVFTIDTTGGRLNLGGDNVIAVQGRDRGDQTYLDLTALLVP